MEAMDLSVGFLLTISHLKFASIVVLCCYATLTAESGCTLHYPQLLLWYWIATIMLLNLFF
ncbi:hypothetical protein BDF19DRAFT_454002 [Syncephalis fuscata]|nr:hypothetical protein BDF19DRAFT_454002 [Syncephalis fuscata]